MYSTSTQHSYQRCEIYILGLLSVCALALVVPVTLSLVGLPLPTEISLAIMLFGLNGLIPVSLLAMVAFPIIS